jgi:hypothetical protein
MKIIQHESFVNLYNKDKKIFDNLLKDVNTLTKLSNRIIKLSNNFEIYSYKDAEKVKGDMFEIFSECFFKILSADNRIGVYGYKPAPANSDYGVDGFGLGMDESPLTVQVKFRSDVTSELKSDDIKQFAFQSIVEYNVDKDTRTNMIVFTNSRGLHWLTESKVFSGRVRAIAFDTISQIIDNNSVFWKELSDLVEQTILEKYK